MRQRLAFGLLVVLGLAAFVATEGPAGAAGQPPAAPAVQPLPPVPTPPGTTVVVPAQPAPPGTAVVVPAQPVPVGTAVVAPAAPCPGGGVIGAPPHPVPAAGRVQPFRYVPPMVYVPIPGPMVYGPGPFLVSKYNPLGGPPYALPAFSEAGVVATTQVRLSYTTGRAGEITVTAPANATFPADVGVQSVADTANNLSWDVKRITVSPDRKQLTIAVEGKGRPSGATGPGPQSGTLTVTLTGSGTLPRVDPVPVTYIVDR